MGFAIKDAIDLTFNKIGKDGSVDSGAGYKIDFLNDIQIQMDAEQLYATKKGNNAVSFSSGRTGTLTMNAEVIDMQFLAMMLGGVMTGDSGAEVITVDGSVPTQAYQATGTFRIVNEGGVEDIKRITFYNLQAQVGADLTLSATEVSSFSLVLDILVGTDANKNPMILKIEDAGA